MAKKEHYYTQFESGGIYHVYNRSIDKKPMFLNDENYMFFIRQFDKYLSDFIKIQAYCLLGNHFHFMIQINDLPDLQTFQKLSNLSAENINVHQIISHQFKKFFQSYAMAFNKQHNRVGTLFQTSFKRVLVKDEQHLLELVCYINTNAQKHGLVKDFKNWKWSSYNRTISETPSKIQKEVVLEYFDGKENFIYVHDQFSCKIDELQRSFFIED